jgi:hypothetical protein
MYALAIKNLPDGKDWLYEVKFDGYRCLAGQHNNVRPVLYRNRPTELKAKYLCRSCPRCNGYLGIVVPERKAKMPNRWMRCWPNLCRRNHGGC